MGGPAGAETFCAFGSAIARHAESFDVRTSTLHRAGAFSACQSNTSVSEAAGFGASPSWRYGFSRNGAPDSWLSRSANGRSMAATLANTYLRMAKIISNLNFK